MSQSALEERLRDQHAVRDDDDRRRAEIELRVGRSGWSTGIPSRSAATFAGGAATFARVPRPVGACQQVAISCGGEPLEHISAERRRRGDGDPHAGRLRQEPV